MMITVNRNKYLLISVMVHALVLSFAFFQFDFKMDKLGRDKEQIISASISELTATNTPSGKFLASSLRARPNTARARNDEVNKAARTRNVKTAITKSLAKIQGNGNPIPELVAKLHAAIQAKQRYPDSAMEMQRQGRVKLIFTLLPNGYVEHLRIQQSSGTASLDSAALTAVQNALPFSEVNKYLQYAQEYSIDLVFQLT